MTSRHHYVSDMVESGYTMDSIGSFHCICMPYLGKMFFPDEESRILDIAVGSGHCSIPLLSAGYKNLYGIDIDPYNFKILEEKGISCFQVDVESEPFPFEEGSMDAVLSFHLIEHLREATLFMSESHRVLDKGGHLILVTPDWRRQYKIFWRDHTHVRPYDKESIARLLRCFDFQVIWLKSFGVLRGISRSRIWKVWNSLMFTGRDLIAVARKE